MEVATSLSAAAAACYKPLGKANVNFICNKSENTLVKYFTSIDIVFHFLRLYEYAWSKSFTKSMPSRVGGRGLKKETREVDSTRYGYIRPKRAN